MTILVVAVCVAAVALLRYLAIGNPYPDSAYREAEEVLERFAVEIGPVIDEDQGGRQCSAIRDSLGGTCSEPFVHARLRLDSRDEVGACRELLDAAREVVHSIATGQFVVGEKCEFTGNVGDTHVYGRLDEVENETIAFLAIAPQNSA